MLTFKVFVSQRSAKQEDILEHVLVCQMQAIKIDKV